MTSCSLGGSCMERFQQTHSKEQDALGRALLWEVSGLPGLPRGGQGQEGPRETSGLRLI